MNLMRAAFLVTSFLLAALPASAAVMQAYAPSTPQVTCEGCFFPQPLVVLVYDDSGRPLAGVPVTFSAPSPAHAFVPGVGTGPFTELTDTSGVARMTQPGLVVSQPGAFTVVATSPAASNAVVFDLQVAGGPPARIESGTFSATAMVGTAHTRNFVARVYDANEQPLQHALVEFQAPAAGASATFDNGTRRRYSRASVYGEAYAGTVTANDIVGPGDVIATSSRSAAGAARLGFTNSAAGVASIEPTPGSTPQSARVYAFYPEFIGAIVRDAAGNPVQDAAVSFLVTFRETGGYGFFMTVPGSSMDLVVVTGPDGLAMPPARLLVMAPGSVELTASVPGVANDARYDLAALPGAVTRFEVVSGANQSAVINTAYRDPWVIRASGDDGLPVPYAFVHFAADGRPEFPGGTFDGARFLYAMADAAGIATARFTANSTVGSHFASVHGFGVGNQPGPYAQFWYQNLPVPPPPPPPPPLEIYGPIGENSLALGAVGSYMVGLFRADVPVAGVRGRFWTDPACATFEGGAESLGISNEYGWIYATPFTALALSAACPLHFQADGMSAPLSGAVHIFDPARVDLAVGASTIEVTTYQTFRVDVTMNVDGLPVNALPLRVQAGVGPSGATAWVYDSSCGGNAGRCWFLFQANDRPGKYPIEISYGGRSIAVDVKQLRR